MRRKLFCALYVLLFAACCVVGLHILSLRQEQDRGETLYEAFRADAHSTADLPGVTPPAGKQQRLPAASRGVRNLRRTYPALVAWLQIPETPVDYPVMQSADNRDYLDHMPDGTPNTIGSIFMDARSSPDGTHLILYGHNVSRGTMFGSLRHYRDPDYRAAHPTITLTTDRHVYTCEIFSVHAVNAYDGEIYSVPSADAADAFAAACKAASRYEIPVTPAPGDRVLTLSTCTGGERAERFVVHARIGAPDPIL